MFDVTTSEFLLIALVGLVVVGPRRLVEVSRQAGRFVGRLRAEMARYRQGIQEEIDRVAALTEEPVADVRRAGDTLREAAKAVEEELAQGLRVGRESVDDLRRVLPTARHRPADREGHQP